MADKITCTRRRYKLYLQGVRKGAEMKNRGKINFVVGWFRADPLNVIRLSLGEVIQDYPSGGVSIVLFQIVLGKLVIALCIDKE